MEIFKAKHEHVGEIALLNDAVQRMHAENYPEVFKYPTDTAEVEKFFRDRISDNNGFIFMARISGQAVGYVWCNIQRRHESVFKHGQERIYIHQLSVKPEHRRKGIARKLMHAVERVAKKNGISRFALDSWEFNKEAHTFFEQLGFSCFLATVPDGSASYHSASSCASKTSKRPILRYGICPRRAQARMVPGLRCHFFASTATVRSSGTLERRI